MAIIHQPQSRNSLVTVPSNRATEKNTLWHHFLEDAHAKNVTVPADPHFRTAAATVFAHSDFVASTCLRNPRILVQLHQKGDLDNAYPQKHYPQSLANQLKRAADEADLMARLRQFRQREMVRIAWRDLIGNADLQETLTDLSRLADACLDETLSLLHEQLCQKMGTPVDDQDEPIQLTVLGMGKLGARRTQLFIGYRPGVYLSPKWPPERRSRSYGHRFFHTAFPAADQSDRHADRPGDGLSGGYGSAALRFFRPLGHHVLTRWRNTLSVRDGNGNGTPGSRPGRWPVTFLRVKNCLSESGPLSSAAIWTTAYMTPCGR